MPIKSHVTESLLKTTKTFINTLPVVVGMLLATSLVIALFPDTLSDRLFGHGSVPDTVLGATIGSIAVGHPLASYLLGGELLGAGTGLTAVTALLIAWVTVGLVQLPAESLVLGTRFAVYRNVTSFLLSIIIALLAVHTLQLLGYAW